MLGTMWHHAHSPPRRCRPGCRRYAATNRVLTNPRILVRSDRGFCRIKAPAKSRWLHISQISKQVRPRHKRPATAFAVEQSTQTRIFNSQPESIMAAASPNASVALRARDQCSASPLLVATELRVELHILTASPPTVKKKTLMLFRLRRHPAQSQSMLALMALSPIEVGPGRTHDLRGRVDVAGDPIHLPKVRSIRHGHASVRFPCNKLKVRAVGP